ncbi:MAG: glycoside hydrolase family 3 N-terminal domain-containing protein [Gemmatimonadaceae bacterium]
MNCCSISARARCLTFVAALLTACTPRTVPSNTTPAAATVAASVTPGAPGEDRFVDSVLALMTLEEKAGQLNQLSGLADPTGPGGAEAGAGQIRRGEVGSLLNVVGADTTRALQHLAVTGSRLHIPLLFALDVIHGFRTTFPVPLGEAASWNPEIGRQGARIAATEAAAAGIMWTFAPMVDIARDARWGRIVEGAGEDPFLGSAFAISRVRGFQGTGLQSPTSIAATVKHFAAYGAAEAGRDYNVADIPERTLRDVYLPPFHAAVCAGAQTLMSSFNEIDGVPAHANPLLTREILRREWGFNGVVVSDWTGIGELLNHGIGADSADVGKAAIDAGVDVDMVADIYRKTLPGLVRSGRVPQAEVDDAVRRVLRLKYRLGLFSDPYRGISAAAERSAMVTAASRSAARESARQSIVLLKNDGGVLPLKKTLTTVAVIGALGADTGATIGNWGGAGRKEDAVSVLDGVRRALPNANVLYARGASPASSDSSGIASAVATAKRANAVILVVGETPDMSAEASSRATIDLPGAQMQLVRAVRAAGVPTVVVLMNGRPLALQELDSIMPAIVETWFLGIEHGTATADVLFGDYNPGGRLPVTFPRVTGQVPIYYAHKNTGRPSTDTQKYTSRYIDVSYTPLYTFGHGLSYTTFSYSAPRPSASTMTGRDTLHVEIDVTNTGAVAGDAVAQLYVRDDVGSITRPVRQLRGFARVTLAPGEKRTLRFPITARDLAFHDASMRLVTEPGTFTLYSGPDAAHGDSAKFSLRTADGKSVPVADDCDPAWGQSR